MSRTVPFFLLLLVPALAVSQWSNGQNATHVLGQPDFTTGTGSTSSTTLFLSTNYGGGMTIDFTTNKMYVADCANNRVLRYSYPAGGFGSDQPTAEAVFGQANFSGSGAGISSTTMSQPKAVFSVRDTLWVAEYSNNRVTAFFNASTKTNGAAADLVLGQPDLITSSSGTTAAKMRTPSCVTVDGSGNVYVSEYLNNRVLKFNKASLANSASADVVFGQLDKTSAVGGNGAANLAGPWDIVVKNNSLFVAEYSNHRVIRYDNISAATDGAAGANIFGNTVMGGGFSTTTQGSVSYASSLAIDELNRLYVGSWDHSRVMIFPDAFTASNGPNATYVLGQTDFTSNGINTTQSTFKYVNGVFIDPPNRLLYVVDIGNHRILQFTASSMLPVELTTFTGTARRQSVELNWKTATETNNYGFEVERTSMSNEQSTINNQQWRKIGFAEGAGNSNAPREYSFADKGLRGGTYNYRLKQIDRNGNFNYTEAITVEILVPRELTLSQNYPNPFNPSTTIEFTLPEDGRVSLKIFDVLGREVATLINEERSAGVMHSATFDASAYGSGIYFSRLEYKSAQLMKRLLLVK